MAKVKKWSVGSIDRGSEEINRISKELGISSLTSALLYRRGYRDAEEARRFIRLDNELFHDPFLMKDMDKACNAVADAIEGGRRIVVYGDYDVDGVTSVSILCLYLRSKGAEVEYYIPNRAGEGYGVNKDAIKKLADGKNTLFITVDTGITAYDEALFAAELGCEMIITDHHECHDRLPDALAVVNPKREDCGYPFKELAGVGVAFKLVCALEYTLRARGGAASEGFLEKICREYIDLAALGTIADVMPLRDENRLIVSMGLDLMARSARKGLAALMEASDGGKSKGKKKVSSSYIGFTVAPRINAAGRISSASRAAQLFLSDSDEECAEIAEELCRTNRQRQNEENHIIEQVKDILDRQLKSSTDPVIVLENENWHHGVIGIVASRITEKYNRPSILVSFEGELGKGSGRSIKGLNLVEALGSCSDLLLKYGGHELAAGLSIERGRLDQFKKRINEYAREKLKDVDPIATLEIDCEIDPSEVSLGQAKELELLEPFGISNPVPMFAMCDLTVQDIIPIGSGRHSKLLLERDGVRLSAVYFGACPDELGYAPGDYLDIAFNLGVNEFQGRSSEQLLVRDIRPSEQTRKRLLADLVEYRAVASGQKEAMSSDIPAREDFVSIYLSLKRRFAEQEGRVCVNRLRYEFNNMPGQSRAMSYRKLRFILDILAESGVIELREKDSLPEGLEVFGVKINNIEKKVNLEKSCLYKRLTDTEKRYSPV